MAVTWRIPDVLRRYAGGAETVPARGATVRAALEDLLAREPGLKGRVLDERGRLFGHLVVFRNDDELPRANLLDTPLEDGDLLDLVAPAAGG